MEIKVLVDYNSKQALDNFIKDCEKQGFDVTRRGGGNLPNWQGWFAELKGKQWQVEDAEKENKYHFAREMLFALRSCHAITDAVYQHWIDKMIEEEKTLQN